MTKTADTLMELDGTIWDRLNISSGGEVYDNAELFRNYMGEVKAGCSESKIRKVGSRVYKELENYNYHLLNTTLSLLGYYGEIEKERDIARCRKYHPAILTVIGA